MVSILEPLFQFHKGTIKPAQQAALQRAWQHFNSIKVRLNRSNVSKLTLPCLFQFHKGTIKPR